MALAYQIKKICRISSLLQLSFPFQPLLYFFIYMLEMYSIVVNFTFELLPERFQTNTVWTIFYYFTLHLFCFWQTFFFFFKRTNNVQNQIIGKFGSSLVLVHTPKQRVALLTHLLFGLKGLATEVSALCVHPRSGQNGIESCIKEQVRLIKSTFPAVVMPQSWQSVFVSCPRCSAEEQLHLT